MTNSNAVIRPSARQLLSRPVLGLAFGFGSGLSPRAPGTAGTLVAVPLYFLLAPLPLWAYLAVLLVTFVLGVYLCGAASRSLGVHDHPGIVWDEFVGYWVTMFAAPAGWLWVLLGFAFFRLFDVLKPWPIRWLDRQVHGGFGIMVDDLVAGLMGLGCLQLCYWLWG